MAEWVVPDSAVVGVALGSWEVVLVGGAGGGAGGQRLTVRDLRMDGSPLALAAEMIWCWTVGGMQWLARWRVAGAV